MFLLLPYLLTVFTSISCKILIRDSGVMPIQRDDMGLILYLSVKSTYEKDVNVSVHTHYCRENFGDNTSHITMVGGHMGVLKKREEKNLTLIYPNLYLLGRSGVCRVAVCYQIGVYQRTVEKDVSFDGGNCFHDEKSVRTCESQDQDPTDFCNPADCTVKYSAQRSYFHQKLKTCQPVTDDCLLDSVYVPMSNKCRRMSGSFCKGDMEALETGNYDKGCHVYSEMVSYRCHHGIFKDKTEECVCDSGWMTDIDACTEELYIPNLAMYHMCNVEINSWGEANKQKLFMTILAILIFALAIAAKMLIAACLLNWCCTWLRNRRNKDDSDESICELYNCPNSENFCHDEECPLASDALLGEKRSSRSGRVSFSDMEVATSDSDGTDITISVTQSNKSSEPESGMSSSRSVCHCQSEDR